MSDKKRHLNPLLLLIAILLCLSAGFLFRRTSFDPNYKIPARHSSVIKKSKVTPTPVLTQKPKGKRQHFCYTDHYGRAFCLSF
mgnify:CR=1 FL=1